MGFGITAIGQGTLAAQSQQTIADLGQTREALYVGSARGILAASTMLLMPVYVEDGTFAGDCDGYLKADAALLAGARSQKKGRSLVKHGGTVAVNVAVTLTLGLGYDQWKEGVISGLTGLAIGELAIWTQPTGLIGWGHEHLGQHPSVALVPMIDKDRAGLGVVMIW